MADDFEDRINHNASFFDGILSLTPVDLYFGRDNSNQWQTKKQPLNKKRDSRLAKLDPANAKAARDLVDEINPANETKKKRKREEVDEEEQDIDIVDGSLSDVGDEQDETLRPNPKKQKRSSDVSKSKRATGEDDDDEIIEDRKRKKAEKRAEKRARKNDLKAQMKEKKEQQKARKKSQQTKGDKAGADELNIKEALTFEPSLPVPQDEEEEQKEAENTDQGSTPSSGDEQSEIFSPPHESGTSSTSSIHPSTLEETLKPTSDTPSSSSIQPSGLKDTLKPIDTTTTSSSAQEPSSTPRERLQAAIQQRRDERKAAGADGRAPKNRQELLEQRRRKEEQRKAAKKEQKRREKEEEARLQDEEIARRFSPGGSGSLLASPRSPVSSGGGDNNVFSFGRIAFSDGTHFDPSTADVVDEHKRKGPRDTAAQLKIALAKKNKLSGLDEAKRQEIEQKNMWLNAKKRAHGEHVKDDTSLLKKALKRQQGQKKKSEREWTDRIQGVQKAQELKQKKRTENLAKRKEGKHKGGGKKVVKRPGFEGSFKGRTGGRKK